MRTRARDMKRLIEELISIKQDFLELYRKAHEHFSVIPEEREFANFLGYLADESSRCLDVLIDMYWGMNEQFFYMSFIHKVNCRFLKSLLSSARTSLKRGIMTKENMCDFIIMAEFSKCTGAIFNLVKSEICPSVLRPFSVNIQLHLSYIERFLETRMGRKRFSERFISFYQSANMTLLAG